MPKARKSRKRLTPEDFAGDGEPYSEVVVTISIRVLGAGITRSRLRVNVVPDPALEAIARKSLIALGKENYGLNEGGYFGASLSRHFSGWEDLEGDYPMMNENSAKKHGKESLQAMNAYIKESVDWAIAINKQGMEDAAQSFEMGKPGAPLVQ